MRVRRIDDIQKINNSFSILIVFLLFDTNCHITSKVYSCRLLQQDRQNFKNQWEASSYCSPRHFPKRIYDGLTINDEICLLTDSCTLKIFWITILYASASHTSSGRRSTSSWSFAHVMIKFTWQYDSIFFKRFGLHYSTKNYKGFTGWKWVESYDGWKTFLL